MEMWQVAQSDWRERFLFPGWWGGALFLRLETCRLSLLPATRSLRFLCHCERSCDTVMTTKTRSARRSLEGHLGLVRWLNNAVKLSHIFLTFCFRGCRQPSWHKPAQGQSWPGRKCRHKKTFCLVAPPLKSVLLLGFLYRSQSNSLLLKPGSSCISVTWTGKHPKSYIVGK